MFFFRQWEKDENDKTSTVIKFEPSIEDEDFDLPSFVIKFIIYLYVQLYFNICTVLEYRTQTQFYK
jgi:hypothetical protein